MIKASQHSHFLGQIRGGGAGLINEILLSRLQAGMFRPNGIGLLCVYIVPEEGHFESALE